MSDELERQLHSFGQTLSHVAGEPVRPEGAAHEPTRRPRRWWAVLGAAACLVAAIAGIALLVGSRDPDDVVGSTDTSGPATIEDPVEPTVPAPDVPFDALRLDVTDWTVRSRSGGPYAVIDVMGCGERGEYDALVGHSIVRDDYERPGLPRMSVTFAQYESQAAGSERLLSAIDLPRCDGFVSDSYERLDLGEYGGVWAEGHRIRDSFRLALVGSDGQGVLIDAANDAGDETIGALVARSVSYLSGDVDEVDPAQTVSQLDDLLVLVGDDPLGMVAEGWTLSAWWHVGPFEPTAWPVCGPPAVVESAAGAPILDLRYRSPDGTDWAGGTFLLEPDAARRAEIGAAITASPGCAPESLVPGEWAAAIVDRGDEGVWGRGDTYTVAPPGDGALPLVAIVDADLVERALEFLAPTPLAVRPDPLGLERDGWTLVQRTVEPLGFSVGEIPCEAAAGLAEFNGAPEVHDILTPPDGQGLDLDISVIEVGSLERGNELAAAVLAIADCIAGVEVSTTGLSSIRASWFRAGPDFALVTIVGEGELSIVLEVEGDRFDDELLASLATRANDFLVTGETAPTPEVIGPDLPRRRSRRVLQPWWRGRSRRTNGRDSTTSMAGAASSVAAAGEAVRRGKIDRNRSPAPALSRRSGPPGTT